VRLAILSRNVRLYSTSRLIEAARARGHLVEVFDPIRCVLVDFDVVLPRIGASITDYGLAVLGHFERHGVPICNSALAIARSRDKLRALQLLSAHDVGIPRTAMARDAREVRAALDAVGGAPVVIKLLQGTQGVGVIIADSKQAVKSTVDALFSLGQNIILQEFVAESQGRDVRALVVGGEVVAAMRRVAGEGEFRSNLHRGGASESILLADDYRHAALEATRIMGLDVAGVDLLEANLGPRVIEVNSSPGLRGVEKASGVDIAQRIIEHCERLHREKAA
jgi:ribosomal protein S6--L-glutamate ligase